MMKERFRPPPSQTATPSPEKVLLKDLPDFWMRPYTYKVDPYLRAAAALQAMGKVKAEQQLLTLAHDRERGDRIFILCRMLFTRNEGKEFRRPRIGAAFFVDETPFAEHTYADWPLEPITLIQGVPFLVVKGYLLGGAPELPAKYVRYCMTHCKWNTDQFQPRDAKEKRTALTRFFASRKWKTGLDAADRQFLASQIR